MSQVRVAAAELVAAEAPMVDSKIIQVLIIAQEHDLNNHATASRQV